MPGSGPSRLLVGAASAVASYFVLHGTLSWFRLYLAFVLVFFGTAGGAAPSVVAELYPRLADPAELSQGMAWIALSPLAYVFPDGRFVPGWARWLAAGLPAAVEVAAYRIAHEACTNVARHARASACRLTVSLSDHALHVEVTDNGRGIAPQDRAGVGTASMRERAEELGGTLSIEASSGGGTRVSARLPLPDHLAEQG